MNKRNNENTGSKGFFDKTKRIPLINNGYTIVDIQDGVSDKGVDTVSFVLESQSGVRIPKIYYATKKGLAWLQKDLLILFNNIYSVTDLESDVTRKEILKCKYTCEVRITWSENDGRKFRNIYFQGPAVMAVSYESKEAADADYSLEYMEDDEHVDDGLE
jgi:hypothetical protein